MDGNHAHTNLFKTEMIDGDYWEKLENVKTSNTARNPHYPTIYTVKQRHCNIVSKVRFFKNCSEVFASGLPWSRTPGHRPVSTLQQIWAKISFRRIKKNFLAEIQSCYENGNGNIYMLWILINATNTNCWNLVQRHWFHFKIKIRAQWTPVIRPAPYVSHHFS